MSARNTPCQKILFAEFTDKKKLGEGSFNEVYFAKYNRLLGDHSCVLKVVSPEFDGNKNVVEKLDREAKEIAEINHVNIVCLLAYVIDHRNICLAYEYTKFGSLANIRYKRIILGWGLRQKIAFDTTKAICYLHEKGLLHRNLKISNILLFDNALIKVSDFFLIHQETWMTQAGKQRDVVEKRRIADRRRPTKPDGTLIAHVPPETIRDITKRATYTYDAYSFGVVLLDLVDNVQLYSGKSTTEVFKIVNEHKAVEVQERKQECPLIMHQYMKDCLNNDEHRRPKFEDMRVKFEEMCQNCVKETQQDFEKFVEDHNNHERRGSSHFAGPSSSQYQNTENPLRGRAFYESQPDPKAAEAEEENQLVSTARMQTSHYTPQPSVQPTVRPTHPEEDEVEEKPTTHTGTPHQVQDKATPFTDDPPLMDVQQQNIGPPPQVVIQADAANIFLNRDQDNLPVTRSPAIEIPMIPARGSRRKAGARDLNMVASNVGSNWKLLARNMGLDECKIDSINYDFDKDGAYEKAYQSLKDWETRRGGNITISDLVDVLCTSNLQNIATRLQN